MHPETGPAQTNVTINVGDTPADWTPEQVAHFRKLWEDMHKPKPQPRRRHGVGMEAIRARDRIHKLSEAIGLLMCVGFAMYGAWTVAKDLARWLVYGS